VTTSSQLRCYYVDQVTNVTNDPVAKWGWTGLREAARRARLHHDLQTLVLDAFEFDSTATVERSLVYLHVAERLGRSVSNELDADTCDAVLSLPGVIPIVSCGQARFKGLRPRDAGTSRDTGSSPERR
jgi:hypothetical protein